MLSTWFSAGSDCSFFNSSSNQEELLMCAGRIQSGEVSISPLGGVYRVDRQKAGNVQSFWRPCN
jgi:hypothetical protein